MVSTNRVNNDQRRKKNSSEDDFMNDFKIDYRLYDSLKYPSLQSLERLKQLGFESFSFAQNMHPNPVFYKYYWWVFSKYSSEEGDAFLSSKNMMCTHNAMICVQQLKNEGCQFIVYNKKCPRWGDKTPFDQSKDLDWAPDYDEDNDPEWNGHK